MVLTFKARFGCCLFCKNSRTAVTPTITAIRILVASRSGAIFRSGSSGEWLEDIESLWLSVVSA